MVQVAGDLDLAQEALAAHRDRDLGAEHLHGDGAVVRHVASQVHGRHAALPELALDVVPTR